MKAVLYDVEWQVLRVKLLNDNSDDGGWTTVEGTQRNLDTLRQYLAYPYCDCCDKVCELRKYRVKNCLNAVRMGYSGQEQVGSDMDRMVAQFKHALHYDELTVRRNAVLWDWNRVQAELEQLKTNDVSTFKAVLHNLQRRRRSANRNAGGMRQRDELAHFLHLMELA